MAPREDCRKNLFDDIVLSHDDLSQFLLHQFAVVTEFLQDIAQASLFG